MTPEELRSETIADLGRFERDPLGFVLWAFPWGVEGTQLADETGPDEWQREQLAGIGESLRDDPFRAIQEATASGHGIGKSSEVAWIILWALMTFEDTRGVVTANTDGQLRTKTWPELAKWFHLLQHDVLKELFVLEATSIHSTDPGHERNWRIDAIPWSERNPEAFAGLHNAGKRVVLLFDEASTIHDLIWETTSGAVTDANTQVIWLAYGNPTRNTGRFKETLAGRFRSQWKHRAIDSRTVKRTNKAMIDQLVEVYGIDSDYIRVRVLGQFPHASSLQFIGSDLVQAARTRQVGYLASDPIIFGVDCARFGDDHSTLAIRRGRDARTFPWRRWHGADSMTLAGDIAVEARKWQPAAIFIDDGSIGGGVIDRLRQLHVQCVIPVSFGGKGRDSDWATGVSVRTANKRAEIWTSMRAWLSAAAIPDDGDLEADLIGPQYSYNKQDQIQLERKEDMKRRGLASPDDADALACTFAEHVDPLSTAGYVNPEDFYKRAGSYDRYAELNETRTFGDGWPT